MNRKIGIITYHLGFIWKIPIIRCMAPPFNVGDLILITGLWQVLRLQAIQNQWHEREGSQLEWILKDCFLSIIRSIAIQFLSEKSLMPEIQFRCHQMSSKSSRGRWWTLDAAPLERYSDISNNRLNRILSDERRNTKMTHPQYKHISTVSPFINKTL